MATFGFSKKLLLLFASYFTNRKQYVFYKGSRSAEFLVFSGVPQGSILGPLLFLLFINDIGSIITHSSYLLFADDLKLYRIIKNLADCVLLQIDVNSVANWAKNNCLSFSAPKCNVVSFTRAKQTIIFEYSINDNIFHRFSQIKDLGVTFDSKMTFHQHTNDLCNRAYKLLGFVIRNSRSFQNPLTIRLLYNSLVLSVLESNCIIWAPFEASYILNIERVHKKFLRFLFLRLYGTYPYLYPSKFILGMTNYHSLETRRCFALLKYFFQLINGLVSNGEILARINLFVPESHSRARHHNILYCRLSRTNLYPNSPVGRAIRYLNILDKNFDIFFGKFNEFVRFLALHSHCENGTFTIS